jgi:hypothetical protein
VNRAWIVAAAPSLGIAYQQSHTAAAGATLPVVSFWLSQQGLQGAQFATRTELIEVLEAALQADPLPPVISLTFPTLGWLA